jgi:AAA domain-containing protein
VADENGSDDVTGTVHDIDEIRRRARAAQYASEGFGSAGVDQRDLFGKGPLVTVDAGEWNEQDIPRRPWIAHGYALRGHLTVLSGPGAGGKSMITIGWAIALAMGKAFHRFRADAPCRCLLYNVEDDTFEQRRRLSAALRQFDAAPSDLAGRVIRVSPSANGTLVHRDKDWGATKSTDILRAIEEVIDQHNPDVAILDPFIELHDSDENDNNAIRAVLAHFRNVAIKRNIAVILLHHARKGSGSSPGDPDTVRGASAIASAARIVLTLTVMSSEEADTFGIDGERRLDFFRIDGAKLNHSPVHAAEWFERIAYQLDNGEQVAAAVPWTPPSLFKNTNSLAINALLDHIDAGPGDGVLYTRTKRGGGGRWAGQPVIEHLGVTEEQAKGMIATWIKSGLLFETEYEHPEQRRTRTGIRVNAVKRPTV